MKKILFCCFSGLAVLICFFLASSFGEDIKYSCDPKIDAWVKQNKESFKRISRVQLNEYPIEKKIAIYRTLSPQKCESLWVEKFNAIINSPSGWTKNEIEYIRELRNFMHTSKIFYQKEVNNYASYFENWKNLGMKNFNWSRSDVVFLLSTFLSTNLERKDFAILYEKEIGNIKLRALENQSKMISSFTEDEGSRPTCYCALGSDDCATLMYCAQATCTATTRGCGPAFLFPCNGLCKFFWQ